MQFSLYLLIFISTGLVIWFSYKVEKSFRTDIVDEDNKEVLRKENDELRATLLGNRSSLRETFGEGLLTCDTVVTDSDEDDD